MQENVKFFIFPCIVPIMVLYHKKNFAQVVNAILAISAGSFIICSIFAIYGAYIIEHTF